MTDELPRGTMTAAVLTGDGEGLVMREIAIPQPRAGEALVKVAACGVCHTDLHIMKGEVAFPRPAVLGHEISGTIVGFGPGTDAVGLAAGDRVVGAFIMPCTDCDACRRGRDDMCERFFGMNRQHGTLYDGESRIAMPDGSFLAMYSMAGLAEYSVVPVAALARLDDHADLETACILGCAGLTSYGAVVRAGGLEPGASVAIIGTGGVGSSLIAMARAAGAGTIVAVDVAADKLDRAVQLGATHAVDASMTEPVAEVRRIVPGGVDLAFEALGLPATFEQASQMLADGGRMVAIGIAAGAATAAVEITPLVRRGRSIVGSFGGRTRVDLPAVVALVRDGAYDPAALVTRRYPLSRADDAYQALSRREITGRAIITMNEESRV